jgi:hypothetical protein
VMTTTMSSPSVNHASCSKRRGEIVKRSCISPQDMTDR